MRKLTWLALGASLMIGSVAIAANPDTAQTDLRQIVHRPPLPSERIDAELAYLKTALKITDAQTAQWNALAQVLRDIAKHKDAKIQAFRAAEEDENRRPHDPIVMLERRQQGLAEEASDLGALIAAAKPLYASLSADQRKAADGLLPPVGGPPPMGPHVIMGPMPMWRAFPD